MHIKNRIFRAAVAFLAIFVTFSLTLDAQVNKPGLHTVVIDPGHGGQDPGCVSKDKATQEKAIALTVATKLSEKLKAGYPDMKVKMTRTSNDVFVPLVDRARYATKNNAELFISIHVNAQSKGTNANGFSVHILGQSKDKNKDTYAFNMDVCRRENEVIYLEKDYSTNYQGLDDNDPESAIFLRLMQTAYREQSLLFAQKVHEKFKAEGPIHKGNGVMQNNFAVLRLASMPAVLVEIGFISNPEDLQIMRSEDNLDKIAQALYDAFVEYKQQYDHSVGADVEKPVKDVKATSDETVDEGKDVAKNETVSDDAIIYGTQIFASRKELKDDDKSFMGYQPTRIDNNGLIKYIIGTSADKSEAATEYDKIKVTYKDAFMIKIEKGQTSRVGR